MRRMGEREIANRASRNGWLRIVLTQGNAEELDVHGVRLDLL